MKYSWRIEKTDIEAMDNDEATALNLAAENGHVDVVKLLLNAKANVEAEDGLGQTPLILATENGHVDAVKLLLNAKANTEAEDKIFEQTPLSWAGANGCGEIAVEYQSKRRGSG